jgi:ribosomal-protein-alanine N-acetyltransferase
MATLANLFIPPHAQDHLRPLDARRDLAAVADLVELCFADTLDPDGRAYLREIRHAARSAALLNWTTSLMEQSPFPYSGFVWEEEGQIVGNLSLIPFRKQGQRCYLIANVAVLPEYRNRGIGQALTETAIEYARSRGVSAAWLQVREDNPTAFRMYFRLGFLERIRRTTWYHSSEPREHIKFSGVEIVPRRAEFWPEQRNWLSQIYPAEYSWHLNLNWRLLPPGWRGRAYRFLNMDFPKQWAALRQGKLMGVLTWTHASSFSDSLWLAIPPEPDPIAVQLLLVHARQDCDSRKPLSLNLPAGLAYDAIRASGFYPQQTLIWMEYRFSEAT